MHVTVFYTKATCVRSLARSFVFVYDISFLFIFLVQTLVHLIRHALHPQQHGKQKVSISGSFSFLFLGRASHKSFCLELCIVRISCLYMHMAKWAWRINHAYLNWRLLLLDVSSYEKDIIERAYGPLLCAKSSPFVLQTSCNCWAEWAILFF